MKCRDTIYIYAIVLPCKRTPKYPPPPPPPLSPTGQESLAISLSHAPLTLHSDLLRLGARQSAQKRLLPKPP